MKFKMNITGCLLTAKPKKIRASKNTQTTNNFRNKHKPEILCLKRFN